MIWGDKVSTIIASIRILSVYAANDLSYTIFNQAKDWLCTYKPWRDLRVDAIVTLDSEKKITLPDDFGMLMFIYSDASGVGIPSRYYELNSNDISQRYTEETTFDPTTNKRTIKLAFPVSVSVPGNMHVVYSKVLPDVTVDDLEKFSFFPLTLMLVVARKILQDYYGVPAKQDPSWIVSRVAEELRMFEAYAYENNAPLSLRPRDANGQPIYIAGMPLNGNRTPINQHSPDLPSTLWTGGT